MGLGKGLRWVFVFVFVEGLEYGVIMVKKLLPFLIFLFLELCFSPVFGYGFGFFR